MPTAPKPKKRLTPLGWLCGIVAVVAVIVVGLAAIYATAYNLNGPYTGAIVTLFGLEAGLALTLGIVAPMEPVPPKR